MNETPDPGVTVEGQDARMKAARDALFPRPHNPDHIDTVDVARWDAFDAGWRAALVDSEARERELEQERDLALARAADEAIARREQGAREAVLVEALKAADWLIRCLKDVTAKKVVRGLPEAEGSYDRLAALAGVVEADGLEARSEAPGPLVLSERQTREAAEITRRAEPDGSERCD